MALTGYSAIDNLIVFIENTWGIGFSQSQIDAWKADLKGTGERPRTVEELRRDIMLYRVGRARIQQWVEDQFVARNGTIATANETEAERITRIANEIINGDRTFASTSATLDDLFGPIPAAAPEPQPPPPPAVNQPEPEAPEPDPDPAVPQPPPLDEPTVPERNLDQEAALLYPYLPKQLRDVFVEAWTQYGDQNLALAAMRSSPIYEQYFPGIKRTDGSLRMTELEYAATLDAFDQLLLGVGVNPELFQSQYVNWIEGEVSVPEAADRINTVYQRITNADPLVKGALAEQLGVELDDTAFLVAALDPALGQQVFNRQIDLASIRAEASRQGFRLNTDAAGYLLAGFGNQGIQMARPFFSQAATALPSLNALAERFDADRDVSLEEFGQAQIFQDATQRRRLSRLLGQSASMFTVGGGLGVVRTPGGSLTGLSPR